ncbi:BURP domain protein RD22 [Quillaja saponaria]|uniref:BURP domain protein RD22 n=1 Tax=Quillaja saponaria TaxID=32244 RepID=A0AAD7QHN4_QUISA|nr:BURP domain protein RD22 [Quillaja saponaria]
MEFLHHALFAFLCFCLVLVGSHASSPAEAYWKSILPNTPMPETLRYLIQPGAKITHTNNLDTNLVELPYNDAASATSIPKEKLKELLNQTNFFFEKDLLGKNVRVLTTEIEKETKKQQHNIVKGVQRVKDRAVVCHKMNYAYAVFYCHEVGATNVYTVPLVAADGTKAKAVAVCHTNTDNWNVKHLAFQELQVKPGTVPVCHFLLPESLIWVPN